MTFDERNAAWDGTGTRTFVQPHSRSSVPRVWIIWVQGDHIHYQWGQQGGAFQWAYEVPKGVNLGKKNEMSPEVYALDRSKEMCRKKNWEGYREVETWNFSTGTTTFLDPPAEKVIDFDNLPLSLSFYKPDNAMGAGITKKAEAGEVLYARKGNGLMFVIAKGSGPAKLYSRRMLRHHDDEVGQPDKTWDRRFIHIQEAADAIMPPNSILLGELMVVDKDGKEDFKAIQSLTKSLTDHAIGLLSYYDSTGKRPVFYCWDIAFWGGKDLVSEAPVQTRYEMIHEVLDSRWLIPVQYFDSSFFCIPAHAVQYAIQNGWEGFVVVDPKGVYGDRAYNFKGKPDRPGAFCAKLKPEYEDDFIAVWDPENGYGERSTKGRNDQGIKSVALFQINPKGETIFISNVSSGLTDKMKKELATTARGVWPQVWKVLYTERTYISQGDDTNALTFARYDSTRTDKRPEECINKEL